MWIIMLKNYVLNIYNKFMKLFFGKKLFSWYLVCRVFYFFIVLLFILDIKLNYCEVFISKCKVVENYIGMVYVIVICNGLEMVMGFMCEVFIFKNFRWILKGMEVKYLVKVDLDICCVVEVLVDVWKLGDLFIFVKVYNVEGIVVVDGIIMVWVSEKCWYYVYNKRLCLWFFLCFFKIFNIKFLL